MNNIVEKKGYWITLIVLIALLIAGLIFSIVMIAKYGEPGESLQEAQEEKVVGVMPGNSFLTFCNDDSLYALDANYSSNPVVDVHIVTPYGESDITDADKNRTLWESLKAVNVSDIAEDMVTEPEYIITFKRDLGSDVTVTFQSRQLLTKDGANYNITGADNFFDML